MIIVLALAAAVLPLQPGATPQYQMPPSPPAPASGGDALERELDGYAERLRKQCLSEAGVRIIIANTRRIRISSNPDVMRQQALGKEVADAAYAPRFNLARMIAALRAKARYEAESSLRRPEQSIDLLQRLPKADQVRYARWISGVEPRYPLAPCTR